MLARRHKGIESWHRHRAWRLPGTRQPALLIRLLSQQMTYRDAARLLDVSESMVARWVRVFRKWLLDLDPSGWMEIPDGISRAALRSDHESLAEARREWNRKNQDGRGGNNPAGAAHQCTITAESAGRTAVRDDQVNAENSNGDGDHSHTHPTPSPSRTNRSYEDERYDNQYDQQDRPYRMIDQIDADFRAQISVAHEHADRKDESAQEQIYREKSQTNFEKHISQLAMLFYKTAHLPQVSRT
jgi:hypothetical protein